MNHIEWNAAARFDGFSSITARQTSGGWILSGSPFPGANPINLPMKRGGPRVFASLDTVARYLAAISVAQFSVHQVASDDLFS